MAKNEVIGLALLLALVSCGPRFEWKAVPMDGHRTGVVPINSENVSTGLGVFEGDSLALPSGALYAADSEVARVATVLMEVQPYMAGLKEVIGHSACLMMNDRDKPDLPLGNLVADALRAYASDYFKVPMDFCVVNFGGIRVPLPEGAVTLEDISSMFPFKNYLCWCKVRGDQMNQLLEDLAATPAFMATSGAVVRVKAHQLESALVGGEPVDPARLYNVATLDFLLDGGDKMRIGALSEDVVLSHVLIKDVMLSYVRGMEAAGKVLDATADGRVTMED